jgi:hypothetical protein
MSITRKRLVTLLATTSILAAAVPAGTASADSATTIPPTIIDSIVVQGTFAGLQFANDTPFAINVPLANTPIAPPTILIGSNTTFPFHPLIP